MDKTKWQALRDAQSQKPQRELVLAALAKGPCYAGYLQLVVGFNPTATLRELEREGIATCVEDTWAIAPVDIAPDRESTKGSLTPSPSPRKPS